MIFFQKTAHSLLAKARELTCPPTIQITYLTQYTLLQLNYSPHISINSTVPCRRNGTQLFSMVSRLRLLRLVVFAIKEKPFAMTTLPLLSAYAEQHVLYLDARLHARWVLCEGPTHNAIRGWKDS
ncbi:hypothetical protein JTB14_030622 [Gonioctena quinquepunctata]|nr:hypothetical protein JTB14_030622 [Gonioctena quinquepunctata]